MTGTDVAPLKPPADSRGGAITELWPVPVWLGHLPSDWLRTPTEEPLTDPTVAQNLAFAATVQRAALAACGFDPAARWSWSCTVETWNPGFFVGASHSQGDLRLVVVLTSNLDEAHPDSGALWIHDPRDGAHNVALPGLPWGRPLKLPGRAGMALAVPGWLRWSVTPVREPHSMTVWTATASQLLTEEGTVAPQPQQ